MMTPLGGNRTSHLLALFLCGAWTIMTYDTSPVGLVEGFAPPRHSQRTNAVQLYNSFNVFGAFGNFLNSNNHRLQQRFRPQPPPPGMLSSSSSSSNATTTTFTHSDDTDDSSDNTPAGTYRLLTLPVRSMKPGGLRLFLLLYLLGQQQYDATTDTAVWKADDATSRSCIDYWYLPDRSAVLSITFVVQNDEQQQQSMITIDRVGSDPSTAYLVQEAMIVEGLLQELEHCAVGDRGDTTSEEDRLVTLADPSVLARVRAEVAFG